MRAHQYPEMDHSAIWRVGILFDKATPLASGFIFGTRPYFEYPSRASMARIPLAADLRRVLSGAMHHQSAPVAHSVLR